MGEATTTTSSTVAPATTENINKDSTKQLSTEKKKKKKPLSSKQRRQKDNACYSRIRSSSTGSVSSEKSWKRRELSFATPKPVCTLRTPASQITVSDGGTLNSTLCCNPIVVFEEFVIVASHAPSSANGHSNAYVSVYEVPMFQGNYLEELNANFYGDEDCDADDSINVLSPLVHRDLSNVPPAFVLNVSSTELGNCPSIVHMSAVINVNFKMKEDECSPSSFHITDDGRTSSDTEERVVIGHITILTSEGLVLILELHKLPNMKSKDQLQMKTVFCFYTGEAGATCADSYMKRNEESDRTCICIFTGHSSGILTLHEVQHQHGEDARNASNEQSKESDDGNCAMSALFSNFSLDSLISQNSRDNDCEVSICLKGFFDVPISAVSLFGWRRKGVNTGRERLAHESMNYLAVGLSGYSSDRLNSPLTGSLEIIDLVAARKCWQSSKTTVGLQDFSIWPYPGMGVAEGSTLKRKHKNNDDKRSSNFNYDEGNPIGHIGMELIVKK